MSVGGVSFERTSICAQAATHRGGRKHEEGDETCTNSHGEGARTHTNTRAHTHARAHTHTRTQGDQHFSCLSFVARPQTGHTHTHTLPIYTPTHTHPHTHAHLHRGITIPAMATVHGATTDVLLVPRLGCDTAPGLPLPAEERYSRRCVWVCVSLCGWSPWRCSRDLK